MLLPRRAYTHLFSDEPVGAHADDIQTAGGKCEVLVLPDAVEAWIDAGDRTGPIVLLRVLVSDAETEVLVSDTAIDAFTVEIRSHGRGLWCFSGEAQLRPSVPPQLW